MTKLIEFAQLIALCAVATGAALAAWHYAGVFSPINAPITPLLWLCSAFFWFCAIAWGGAALLTPFRKA